MPTRRAPSRPLCHGSNNSPLDLYSLYREVIACGGFEANERYDERGRWTGGINFAGDVFPMMSNFTPNNR